MQEVVEDALATLLRKKIAIVGAGRTDAGVHAKQLMAHFDISMPIDETQLVYKLNALLPQEIVITSVREVLEEAHARFDAISRSYIYKVTLKKDPFAFGGSYYVKKTLDLDAMNKAASMLLNYTNFKCFSKSKTDVKTYNCTIMNALWKQEGQQVIFAITANRFLRNMVRAIVGTLLEIGEGKLEIEALHDIIESEDRGKAGYSVPAHGLYLTEVAYPNTIYKK